MYTVLKGVICVQAVSMSMPIRVSQEVRTLLRPILVISEQFRKYMDAFAA